MHIFDDYKEKYDCITLLLVSSILIFITLIFLNGITIKKVLFEESVCVFSAVISAFGLSITVSGKINGISLLAAVSFFMAFAYVFQSEDELSTLIVNAILISFPAFSLNLAFASVVMQPLLIVVLALALIAPLLIAQLQKANKPREMRNEANKYVFDGFILSLLVSITIILFKLFADDLGSITGVVSFIVGILATTFAKSSVEKNFDYIKRMEDRRADLKRTSESVVKLTDYKIKSYVLIVMVGVGAILYLVLMLSSYIELKLFWNVSDFEIIYEDIILMCLFIVVLMSMLKIKNINNGNVKSRCIILSVLLSSISYILLAVVVFFLRSPFVFDNNITSYFSFFMVVGSSFMVAESFYSNLIGIRGIDRNRYVVIASGIIFVGNILTISCILLPSADLQGSRSSDLILVLVSIIGCLISTLIIPLLIGRIVQCEIPDLQIATTSPLGGIVQNGFLTWLLVLLGGVVPVYFSSIIKDEMNLLYGVILIVINIYWPLSYCIHNNVEHLEKRVREYSNYEGQDDVTQIYFQLRKLAKHLKRQNIAAFIALLCYCLVPIGIEMGVEVMKTGQIKGVFNNYIPNTNIERN